MIRNAAQEERDAPLRRIPPSPAPLNAVMRSRDGAQPFSRFRRQPTQLSHSRTIILLSSWRHLLNLIVIEATPSMLSQLLASTGLISRKRRTRTGV